MNNLLSWDDDEFINRSENMPLRTTMELQRTYQTMRDAGIKSTLTVFGSARINPDNTNIDKSLIKYYYAAEEFAFKATRQLSKPTNYTEFCICTGGGPSIMEAANKGASEAGGKSIGMAIKLPFEAVTNNWVDPSLSFTFKYFMNRKYYMTKYAAGCIAFPGGVGTCLDEVGEILTLSQTGKMPKVPFVFFGVDFWKPLCAMLSDWESKGLASEKDFSQVLVTDSVDLAIAHIKSSKKLSNVV